MGVARDASFVSEFTPFRKATLSCFEEQPEGTFSGVSKDGKRCWIVRGSHLEILDVANSERLAAWTFGKVVSDPHTRVTCVKEFTVGTALKLLVGVCNASPTGLLCLLDVAVGKVTKTVEIPHPVTEVEVLSTHKKATAPRWALSEHLCYFSGLVAVGTNTGHVLLIDMCTDDEEYFSNEEVPSSLHLISPRVTDIENQRFHCMSQGLHLAMELNETMFSRGGFEYQKPDGVVMKTFRLDMVSVTCLKYIPQTGLLVVGYNFGCYQLWKLQVPVLEYSSRLESEPTPVSHIAYQEPENDPKNFCYIWIARGQPEVEEGVDPTVCSIAMYQLAFTNRAFYSDYGTFYDELTSVCLRLEHELTSSLIHAGSRYEGSSKLISCATVTDPNYQPLAKLSTEESFEEGSTGPDLSLCMFVWEATEGTSKVGRHLAIFDINRWYHAQMPANVRFISGSQDTCAYISWYRLDNASERAGNDTLLAAHIVADRLRKFDSCLPMPPELHFYPSALAFDTKLIFETGSLSARFLGSQRQVFRTMEEQGPSILVQPQELYSMCIHVGLLPRPVSVASVNPSLSSQRESMISVALEYNLVAFIKACIVQWATGEYDYQGCTLKFVLDWAWETVSKLKHKIDQVCVPLFNWSGLTLDRPAVRSLVQCGQKLAHLICILKTFASGTGSITVAGEAELNSKVLVTSLISQHLAVVLWFFGTGLLPENDDTEVTQGGQYCYPATSLMSAYKSRREELASIHVDIGPSDLLLIDGLVENMGVCEIWEREGGMAQYPPPSIHALISSYLLDNCDMLSKHCLVLYLLLDLVSVDSCQENESFLEKVGGFARRFGLPPTLVKLIQAFWLLDHRDFEEAMSLMLDPMVRGEFSRWQHRRVIKSLLYQGDPQMALRYITTLRPALNTPEEVKLKLTVLMANGRIEEALVYQRKCRDKTSMQDLLAHLFLGCQQTNTVDRLLQLHLSEEEERHLVTFLQDSSEPHSQELLVTHYLQRAKFVEAIQLNEKLKHTIMTEGCSKARERASARNAIVERYASVLPSVQRRLLFEQVHVPKKNTQWRREVRRPNPLSTKITQCRGKVTSQSTYIMTIMETLDEMEDKLPGDRPLDKSVGPFICTPVTPARNSVRDTPVTIYPELTETLHTSRGPYLLNKSLTMLYGAEVQTPTKGDRGSRFVSAACMTLLQTPTVKKMTPRKSSLSTGKAVTPQSILKVRNMISNTSPSPHKTSTTPNSLELEGSGRKAPRKLGYGSGSGTPLSSIPRHLATEMSSLPATPKSVSFAEPDDTEVGVTPKNTGSLKPSTPKSVSFADKSISTATKLQLLSTPKQLRFASERSLPSSRSPEGSRSRSLEDRSPTPESPEKSPKFALHLDHLHRKPLHEEESLVRADGISRPPGPVCGEMERRTEPVGEEIEERTERVGGEMEGEEEFVLQVEESDDGNISDENVEEMEGSFDTPATSPASMDLSYASMVTVKEHRLASVGSSITPEHSPVKSLSSPVKSGPSSPTVKVSKSSISQFSVAESRQQSAESSRARSSVMMFNGTERTEATSSDQGLVKAGPVNIDLTGASEDEDMDMGHGGLRSPKNEPKATHGEIFKDYEEINPPGEIEDESMEDRISEDEDESGKIIGSQSEPVSKWSQSPVKVEVEDSTVVTRPSNLLGAGPVQLSGLQRKSLTPPEERNIPLVKKKGSPPDSEYGTQSPDLQLNIAKILQDIDTRFADTPLEKSQLSAVKEEAPLNRSRVRRKFEISVKVETESVPSTSDGVYEETVTSTVDEPLTPTRSSRRLRQKESEPTELEHDSQEPLLPDRSARKKKTKSVATTDDDVDSAKALPNTPTRASRRGNKDKSSPEKPAPISTSRRSKIEKINESLVQIKAHSSKPFTKEAVQVVHEAVLNVSTELKERIKESEKSASDVEGNDEEEKMTKIKDKSVRKSVSPKSTPIGGKKKAATPSRSTSRNKTEKVEREAGSEENVALTPSRTRRGAIKTVSPISEDKSKTTTPTRGRRKKTMESQDENQSNNNEEIEISEVTISEPSTPTARTRGALKDKSDNKRDSFGHSEIPVDVGIPDDLEAPDTPSRRSLGRACKKVDSDEPKTPTRRQSLGRAVKDEDAEVAITPSRRKSLGREAKEIVVEVLTLQSTSHLSLERLPTGEEEVKKIASTRRQSLGRTGNNEIDSEDTVPKSPARGRRKGPDVNNDQVNVAEPVTPTRRVRSKKADLPNESETETDVKPATPSRRGRPPKHVSPERDKSVLSKAEEVATTPTRKGRKTTTQQTTASEQSLTPGRKTPSRRGRSIKSDMKSESEAEGQSESVHVENVTPSRRKKSKKEDKDVTANAVPELYDIQPTSSFQFSDPMQVSGAEESVASKPFTPVKSFIFSPPISHTRSLRRAQPDIQQEAILLPGTVDQLAKEPIEEKKNTRRTKKLYKEKEELLLISPGDVTAVTSPSEDGRDLITGRRGGAKKAETAKDGTKLVVRGIERMLRGRRTSYRIGPLSKKK
ncbi:protein ELYS-like isoform X2 [Dreissena polymorpha]|uniref:protein ELYS-like isoform X2 n=1 Tax=Dreissena polymorpha TaxID=45954 RepID=UPI002263F978|nr:protein ELYS-like isoform X2 [Dreissena polymorpha]